MRECAGDRRLQEGVGQERALGMHPERWGDAQGLRQHHPGAILPLRTGVS